MDIIKKYGNRKLYFKKLKTYGNLTGFFEYIKKSKEPHKIRVVDYDNNKDITIKTLFSYFSSCEINELEAYVIIDKILTALNEGGIRSILNPDILSSKLLKKPGEIPIEKQKRPNKEQVLLTDQERKDFYETPEKRLPIPKHQNPIND